MNEQEVDEKIEEIIAFSECEQFIDTPVKRYSSGMYVKLAFSVAAHLNADIFLMDEVLAVGDMMFQKKCLTKMKEISIDSDKTILYVSHNMQTIRELCDRCIVLDEGRIIHDGDVEEGIRLYMKDILEVKNVYEFTENREKRFSTRNLEISKIELDCPVLGEKDTELTIGVHFLVKRDLSGLHMRFTVYDSEDCVVGTGISEPFCATGKEEDRLEFVFHTGMLTEGEYSADIAVVEPFGGRQTRHAFLRRALAFRIEKRSRLYEIAWNTKAWGRVSFPNLEVRSYKRGENT